jgi:6-phosphogluconolactonase (cycloisomerase 2 family)
MNPVTTSLNEPKASIYTMPSIAQDSLIHVGTYTDNAVLAHDPMGAPSAHGIHTFHLCGSTGTLEAVGVVDIDRPNPAFILKHPSLPIAYTSSECILTDGTVTTLRVEEDGTFTPVSTHGAGGKSTCYLTLMPGEKHLMATNYWDAKLALLPLAEDGTVLVFGKDFPPEEVFGGPENAVMHAGLFRRVDYFRK